MEELREAPVNPQPWASPKGAQCQGRPGLEGQLLARQEMEAGKQATLGDKLPAPRPAQHHPEAPLVGSLDSTMEPGAAESGRGAGTLRHRGSLAQGLKEMPHSPPSLLGLIGGLASKKLVASKTLTR